MKKLFTTLCLAISFLFVYAQDSERLVGTTTKSGQQILPQAGDMAIGIDVNPFLDYFGNMFSKNEDYYQDNDFFSFKDDIFGAPSIYGKYFLSDTRAIRAKLHVGFGSYKDRINWGYGSNCEINSKSNGIGLRVGHEWRRGYGRLQGFFGTEAGFGMDSRSSNYEYDTPIEETGYSNRPIKYSSGTRWTALVGGFVGIEYFIAPKISIGGEVGLSFLLKSRGDGWRDYENYNYYHEHSWIEAEKTGGDKISNIGTRSTGNLFMMFHF